MRRVFLASTVVGLVALMALGYNVAKAFGLVAVRDTIRRAGSRIARSRSSQDRLVAMRQPTSRRRSSRLESERPFAQRSQQDVLDRVVDRVVEPEIVLS
jgi:hypothetical protein